MQRSGSRRHRPSCHPRSTHRRRRLAAPPRWPRRRPADARSHRGSWTTITRRSLPTTCRPGRRCPPLPQGPANTLCPQGLRRSRRGRRPTWSYTTETAAVASARLYREVNSHLEKADLFYTLHPPSSMTCVSCIRKDAPVSARRATAPGPRREGAVRSASPVARLGRGAGRPRAPHAPRDARGATASGAPPANMKSLSAYLYRNLCPCRRVPVRWCGWALRGDRGDAGDPGIYEAFLYFIEDRYIARVDRVHESMCGGAGRISRPPPRRFARAVRAGVTCRYRLRDARKLGYCESAGAPGRVLLTLRIRQGL